MWPSAGLSCGNCTLVCPTCFCSTVTDSTELGANRATRTRQWESCYHPPVHLHHRRPGAQHHPRPLPPLAASQAVYLDRSVRRARLRGLRPLHHVVPRGHRHHAEVARLRAAFQPAAGSIEARPKEGLS